MYVEFEVPDVTFDLRLLGSYWLKMMFIGGVELDFQHRALLSSFVRLVEAAVIEYRSGRAALFEYWSTHNAIALGAMHRSSSHFESCITDMHRATNCIRHLRRRQDLPEDLAKLLQGRRPSFVGGSASGQMRKFRDEIHHLDEMIVDGRVTAGQSIALRPDGPEVAHPSEKNQTIKTIDRIRIADRELRLPDVVSWLTEMCGVGLQIANYGPTSRGPASSP